MEYIWNHQQSKSQTSWHHLASIWHHLASSGINLASSGIIWHHLASIWHDLASSGINLASLIHFYHSKISWIRAYAGWPSLSSSPTNCSRTLVATSSLIPTGSFLPVTNGTWQDLVVFSNRLKWAAKKKTVRAEGWMMLVHLELKICFWLVVCLPLWKIMSLSMEMTIPNKWKNKKCSKPPTRFILCLYE